MTSVDYSYYTDAYKGTAIPEAAFPRLLCEAQTFVSRYTFGRADRPQSEIVEASIKNTCCAVADILYDAESNGGEIASETAGKWSRTYVTSGKTRNQRIREVVRRYLSGTGLTYQGVNAP